MTDAVLGRSPEQLTIAERRAFAGQWAAFELYTPRNLALRRIAALGTTVAECVAELKRQGHDPSHYEFEPIAAAY